MIEARYEAKKGFYFENPYSKENLARIMTEEGDNTLVNFKALSPCTSGDKNLQSANNYVMDRIVSKINSITRPDFEVRHYAPTASSNNTREDGIIEVNSLIFQIHFA